MYVDRMASPLGFLAVVLQLVVLLVAVLLSEAATEQKKRGGNEAQTPTHVMPDHLSFLGDLPGQPWSNASAALLSNALSARCPRFGGLRQGSYSAAAVAFTWKFRLSIRPGS